MTDPVTLGIAVKAVGLVNGTIGLLKEARESAKRSDDHDLKDKLSEVFDSVLELKEALTALREENEVLRKQIETRTALKWNSELKVYFAGDDSDPYCPACMDLNGKAIRLNQPSSFTVSNLWKYQCRVCKNVYVPAQ